MADFFARGYTSAVGLAENTVHNLATGVRKLFSMLYIYSIYKLPPTINQLIQNKLAQVTISHLPIR
jgi:hypothetical protein